MFKKVMETINFLESKVNTKPKIAIILGSGLGGLVDFIEDKKSIPYGDIPNFPISTGEGHAGELVFGKIAGVEVLAMKGRFHFYEGYTMKEVTYPEYVFKMLGIEKLIVTNAAGGINKDFSAGELMIITDHINMFGTNPLIGKNDERFGKRFPDMTEVYSKNLISLAEKIASKMKISYKKGVYLGTTGPTYETAAEIKMMEIIGADAVGMSTVPETTVSNYLGIETLGISCVTNMATGIAVKPHSHQDVVKTANEAGDCLCKWIVEIVKNI